MMILEQNNYPKKAAPDAKQQEETQTKEVSINYYEEFSNWIYDRDYTYQSDTLLQNEFRWVSLAIHNSF